MLNKLVYLAAAAIGCSLSACVQTVDREGAAAATSAALVAGASCDPANALDVATPIERALLDTIAYTEGTRGHGKDGYNVTFGYRYFDSCAEHPNIKVCSGSLCSTAAGRYQFLHKTYLGLKLESFWPEDQERGALELIERRGVTVPEAALTAVEFANALDRLSYEWSSLPPGRYGTPRLTHAQIRAEYCRLAGCGASGTKLGPELLAVGPDGVLSRYRVDRAGGVSATAISYGWDSVSSLGAAADYDEDGVLDHLAIDDEFGLEIYYGDGAGDFDLRPISLGGEPLLTLGPGADYDGDDHADFVAIDRTLRLLLVRGDGLGRFSVDSIALYADDLAALGGGADLNGDERPDFLALSNTGSSWLYAGDGAGNFSARTLELPGSPLALVSRGGDYSGDGRADFVAVSRAGQARLYRQRADAAGTFESAVLNTDWDAIRFLN
jgi:muramidase (phage lysozyme)